MWLAPFTLLATGASASHAAAHSLAIIGFKGVLHGALTFILADQITVVALNQHLNDLIIGDAGFVIVFGDVIELRMYVVGVRHDGLSF